jgi:hypothetical protein
MTDQVQIEKSGSRSPWKAVMVALAVLLVTWYLFPASVVGWLEDHCDADNSWCAGPTAIAESIDTASRSVGVAGTLEGWRDAIRQTLGIDFY